MADINNRRDSVLPSRGQHINGHNFAKIERISIRGQGGSSHICGNDGLHVFRSNRRKKRGAIVFHSGDYGMARDFRFESTGGYLQQDIGCTLGDIYAGEERRSRFRKMKRAYYLCMACFQVTILLACVVFGVYWRFFK